MFCGRLCPTTEGVCRRCRERCHRNYYDVFERRLLQPGGVVSGLFRGVFRGLFRGLFRGVVKSVFRGVVKSVFRRCDYRID